jgi:hypothetical protein
MLEEDPLSLHTSINAWPTGVRIGAPSWKPGGKGAIIEGIRSKPMGSVDFVPRGGAGGRVLTEEEISSAVSLLESAYIASRDDASDPEEPAVKKKLSEMSAEEIGKLSRSELKEALAAENPTLAESLTETAPAGAAAPSQEADTPITQATLDAALTRQRTALMEEFGSSNKAAEELAEELVTEREELRHLAAVAEADITEAEGNGLPKDFGNEIRKNYLLLPSGPRSGLEVTEREVDGKTLSKEDVIHESIKSDIATAVRLIEAAGGEARVTGLGKGAEDPTGEGGDKGEGGKKKKLREGSAFGDFMRESGDFTGDPEKDMSKLSEMVEG